MWLTWISAIVWVVWREVENRKAYRAFDDPFGISASLLAGFPLLLTVTGVLIVRRTWPNDEWPFVYRVLYFNFVGLTALAALVLFLGILITGMLAFTPRVRE